MTGTCNGWYAAHFADMPCMICSWVGLAEGLKSHSACPVMVLVACSTKWSLTLSDG